MTDTPAAEGQAQAPEAQGQVWYDTAPDEVKGYIQNKGWDDPIKAVKSYQELEKFKGASEDQLIRFPKDPKAEGAFDEIYNRLGRPESFDKYQVDLGDAQIDENRLNSYKEAAHKAGLTQGQFEALAKADNEIMGKAIEAYNAERQEKQEVEYNEWKARHGSNFHEREELARRGLRAMLPQGKDAKEITQAIEDAIGTALTLDLFSNVGEKLSREDRIPDSSSDRPFGYTKEQAKADKSALMSELKADSNRLGNYNKAVGPDYDKMQRLNKIIAGQ